MYIKVWEIKEKKNERKNFLTKKIQITIWNENESSVALASGYTDEKKFQTTSKFGMRVIKSATRIPLMVKENLRNYHIFLACTDLDYVLTSFRALKKLHHKAGKYIVFKPLQSVEIEIFKFLPTKWLESYFNFLNFLCTSIWFFENGINFPNLFSNLSLKKNQPLRIWKLKI